MNWEIKFRGLNLNGDKWHIGNLTVVSDKRCGHEIGSYISNSVGMPFAYMVRPETVGQYTSLKDKNGKEIYEWDIIRTNNNDVSEVKFIVDSIGDHYGVISGLGIEFYTGGVDWSDINSFLLVVGNIFENPELLTPNHEEWTRNNFTKVW